VPAHADFESIKKVAKSSHRESWKAEKISYTVLKGEKVHDFYTFMLITFSHLFQGN
jgi:hypothetical protein